MRVRARVLALLVVALVGVEMAWGYTTTPTLYAGEPERRERAREAASTWLAATLRRDDVLFGYDPLFLGAREDGGAVGDIVVPRADAQLAVQALTDAPKPLGRAVWVLDASEGNDIQGGLTSRLEIESRSPGRGFESRAFGPFLVIRTTAPVGSPEAYLRATVQVQQLGQELGIETASLNYRTAALALAALADGESPARSRALSGRRRADGRSAAGPDELAAELDERLELAVVGPEGRDEDVADAPHAEVRPERFRARPTSGRPGR